MQKGKKLLSLLLCAMMAMASLTGMADALEPGTQEGGQDVASGAALSQSVEDGLVSYLKLDDNITDEMGGGSGPDLIGTATYEAGINGKALRFDGEPEKYSDGVAVTLNSNRIEFTGREDLKFGEGDAFSVGFWYKADKVTPDNNIIGSKAWTNAANDGWNIAFAISKINIAPISRAKEGDIQYSLSGDTNYSGKWIYAVYTRTADAQNAFYINGQKVSVGTRTKGSTKSKDAGTVCLGADWEGKYGPGNAVAFDEVKLWNRQLSADEVNYLYHASPETTSMRVTGPENVAVGDSGTAVTLNAKVTKTLLGEVDPVEPVAWTADIGNEYLTSDNGASAQLNLPSSLTEGQRVKVTAKIGGHSADHIITVSKNVQADRITIEGDAQVVKPKSNIQKTYTAKWTDENGAEAAISDPENIQWTMTTKTGVQINGATAGKTVTVDIPADTLVGKTFTLAANYKTFEGKLKVVIAPDREIPQEILNKVETQMDFDGNLDMVTGSKPTLNGSMTYQNGVEGQGAVFTYGNYLDFGNYNLENKSIAFSLKSNKFTGVQDPCIWGNKDWNDAEGKGLIFAYAYNTASSFKTRIGDGTQKLDHTFNYSPEYWSNYVINIDTTNKKYSVYKDGQLVKEMNTTAFASSWQNGAYSLKLGNDGTGNYKHNSNKNSEYEFVVDKLMITNQVLTPEEILTVSEANKVLLTEEGMPEVTIDAVGGSRIPSGQLFNINLHVNGKKTGLAVKTEFDIKYDPAAMRFHGQQYAKSGITLTDDGNGTLHVAYAAAILDNEIVDYNKSRIVQPIFETKELNQKTAVNLTIENIKGYDNSGDEVEINATGNGYTIEVLPVNSLDLNGDGVVGAGDVALGANDQQKNDIADAAGIYPYKRALVITMDGGGKAYDPDKQYLCNESTNSYTVESDLGALRPKDGYAMQMFNNEFAMSYTAKATDPPISAQNYCAITHGIAWKSLPSGYQFTNDIAGAKLWPDFGLETPKYPSMFWAVKNQQPDRKLFAATEWNPITNGILEQDVGTYFQYRASSAPKPLVFDQLEEYIQDGRFKDTALTYLQSDTMDHYGHASGYFTAGYYEELKKFDGYFKQIVDAMKEANVYDDTFFVINSDHGGHRNANGSGSHGTASLAVDMDIMIGARGQTVPAGKRLNGGHNKDIAAMTLSALRVDKPASMNNSEVFDNSLFLTQEDMASQERNVEKVSFDKSGNNATVSISNKQSKDIKALDAVILLNGRTVSAVTPAGGVSVLRQKTEGGKLYLTVSGSSLNGTVATVTFGNGSGTVAMEEVMLGAADGTEIYSDLENLENGTPSLTGTGEISGKDTILKAGASAQETYEVTFKKLSGEEIPVQANAINWSVEGAQGVTLPDDKTGTSMNVTVAASVPSGTVFTLKAEYKGLVAQKEITVKKRGGLPASVKNAIETKVTFDDGIKAQIGSDPTASGAMTYGDGIRGKSGVFTGGNYLDFGSYDLKNKTIAFTLKSNRFTGVKDPVVIANKDWNSANGAGFVWAHAWNTKDKFKTRIADGSKKTDVTFDYAPGEWSNVAIVFDSTGNSFSAYLNGELVKTFDTAGYAANWQNGAFSLKLGNDGTGSYAPNADSASDYEFEVDDFMIINKVLTAQEVAAVNEAQVDAPDITMELQGASKIVAPQNAGDAAVSETYTAVFKDENGNVAEVEDVQNISWTLTGTAGNVSIPQGSTGKSVAVSVAYGAPDQKLTLSAAYHGEDDTVCTASMNIPVFQSALKPVSIRFEEEPESLNVSVPQPGEPAVELKFRAVALGKFDVPMDDVVLDASNYCLLENPSPESAKIEIVQETQEDKTVTYAKVVITDKASVMDKLTLVAYFGDPDSEPNARKEIKLNAKREPKQVVIVGAGSVDARNANAEATYSAYLMDQYGQTIDTKLTWKIEKSSVSGVGISTDGKLIVQKGGGNGTVTISATSAEYHISGTKEITIYGTSNSSGGGSGSGGGGGGRPSGTSSGSSGGVVTGGSGSGGGDHSGGGDTGTPADRFSDLPAGHWAQGAISSLMEKGIISGDSGSNTVRPEAEISREETVKILLGAIDASILPAGDEQTDANTSAWAKDYMLTAKKIGIVKGDEAGNLNGMQSISRIDAMVMVARALGVAEGDVSILNQFSDGWLIPDYAKGAVAKLVELGIVSGYGDGTVGADNSITRAEMFAIVDRIAR